MFRRALPALLAPALARAQASSTVIVSQAARFRVTEWSGELEHAWGGAFLPDGRLLVTERPGRLRLVQADGALSAPLAGVPPVEAVGQGGLLDVALAPDFAATRRIWLSSATAIPGGVVTRLWHAVLDGAALRDVTAVLDATPAQPRGRSHYGGRIAFSPPGDPAGRHLYLSTGERAQEPRRAQGLGDLAGKILRLTAAGAIPRDNPFIGQAGARPEIWSLGHRNPQGLAHNPATGTLFAAEFGPLGGDELNVIRPGQNYGWPLVTHGREYSGGSISPDSSRPGFADPVRVWVPSISPSGLAFCAGPAFPQWQGHAFLACLNPAGLLRLPMQGDTPGAEERLLWNKQRIRQVVFDVQGRPYLLTDTDRGPILRLDPA